MPQPLVRKAHVSREVYAMRMIVRVATALLLLTAAALPARAETYKWVDEKGVTNYSNAPPAGAKAPKAVQKVEDRLSYYESGPLPQRLAQDYDRRAAAAEAEWLQRQQIMAMRAGPAYTDCMWTDCGYGGGYRTAYAPLLLASFRVLPARPGSMPRAQARSRTSRSLR